MSRIRRAAVVLQVSMGLCALLLAFALAGPVRAQSGGGRVTIDYKQAAEDITEHCLDQYGPRDFAMLNLCAKLNGRGLSLVMERVDGVELDEFQLAALEHCRSESSSWGHLDRSSLGLCLQLQFRALEEMRSP